PTIAIRTSLSTLPEQVRKPLRDLLCSCAGEVPPHVTFHSAFTGRPPLGARQPEIARTSERTAHRGTRVPLAGRAATSGRRVDAVSSRAARFAGRRRSG